MTAKEEEAVLLTLILEVQVMNPSDPEFQVRCSVIHPGFTDTPTVRAIGEEYIRTKVISTDSTETADQARRNSRSHLLYDNERRCER
jgi:NAD(P)-dependent dehydrogenase (short-subunit alcohol dehydrogenase family)